MVTNRSGKDNLSSNKSSPISPNPPAVRVDLDKVPAALRACAQFFHWRWSLPADKWTKVPVKFDKHPSGKIVTVHIESNRPKNWLPFEEAAEYVRLCRVCPRPWLGLGFRFAESDPFAFIDLDDCRNPATGEIAPWALEITYRFNSYAEASPSGTGVKIFIRGKKPGRRCRKAGSKIELYDTQQFSTITGQRIDLPGLSPEIEDRQAELEAFYHEQFPPDQEPAAHRDRVAGGPRPAPCPVDVSDEWVVRQAERKPYWQGPNKSEDDLRLCNYLAFLVGPDPARIRRILFSAPARRKKWDRQDYIDRTIDRALEFQSVRGFYADLHPDLHLEVANPEERDRLFDRSQGRVRPAVEYHCGPPPDWPTLDEQIASINRAPPVECEKTNKAASNHRPPPQRCGYKRAMYDPAKHMYIACHVACGRWGCGTCARRLKDQWAGHMRAMITKVRDLGGKTRKDPVYLARVRDDYLTLRRIQRHVNRRGGSYASVKYTPGRALFVSSVPLQPRDNAECVSPFDATNDVERAVRDIVIYGDLKKPISTSRDWKLPPRIPTGKVVIGDFPHGANKREIVAAMEAINAGQCEVREKSSNGSMTWRASCPVPPVDPDGPRGGLSGTDQGRAYHRDVLDQMAGNPPAEDFIPSPVPDILFGVPAGP